jgi:tetratricopeptide (TPR) repeat protein
LQGNFDQAEATLKEAVAVAQAAGYKRGIILASSDLAGVYWQHGNYHQSLTYLQQSQTLSQEIGDEEMSEVSIGNAGLLYHHLGQKDEAISCLLQALAIAIAMNDWATIANQLGNLGNVLSQAGQPDLALALTNRAIELNRSLNMPYYLSEYLQQKARLLAEVNQFAQAIPLNEEALRIARQIQHLEIQFEAELLAVRLRLGLAEIDVDTAVDILKRLATTWSGDPEQAAISYEIAQLAPSEVVQQQAAHLYQTLYKTTPKAIYKQRYQLLTGDTLPDAPPLPPPPQFVEPERLVMDDLLDRVGISLKPGQKEPEPA